MYIYMYVCMYVYVWATLPGSLTAWRLYAPHSRSYEPAARHQVSSLRQGTYELTGDELPSPVDLPPAPHSSPHSTLHPTPPYTLHPSPYAWHPTPTPYTLRHTPYTITPYRQKGG